MPTSVSISPADITQAEGQSGVSYYVFTVNRVGDLDGPTVLDYSVLGSGTNPASASDFQGGAFPSGKVWFGGGESSKQIWVPVVGDTTAEATETFTVNLSNVSGAALSNTSATGTITNDDQVAGAATLSMQNSFVTLNEGDAGSAAFAFTVTRTGDLSGASSAQWTVLGGGPAAGIMDGPATAADFAGGSFPAGTVQFVPGQSSATVTVNVLGDTAPELREAFRVQLSNPSGATINQSTGHGLIVNDDGGHISFSGGGSQFEGNTGQTEFVYTVTRTGTGAGTASVTWQVSGSGGATASDFVGGQFPSATVTFGEGQTAAQFSVLVSGDATVEPDESFAVNLSAPVNAVIPLGQGTRGGTILNDDNASSLTLSNATQSSLEGTGGLTPFSFLVTRSGDLSGAASAGWAVSTVGLPAQSVNAADFEGGVLPSGTVSFAPGQSTASINFNVVGDSNAEHTEVFSIGLRNAVGATYSGPPLEAAIQNDDGPRFSVSNVAQAEGNSGSTPFVFTVTRHDPALTQLNWSVFEGSATGPDFAGGAAPGGGVATFASGQSTATVTINIAGDTAVEPDETFSLFLYDAHPRYGTATGTGTVLNDDASSGIVVAGPSSPVQEGASGSTPSLFTITRTGDTSAMQLVDYVVTGSGADPAEAADFSQGQYPNGTASFLAGETTIYLPIYFAGDTQVEGDEGFTLTVTGRAGSGLGQATASGVIVNDDSAPPTAGNVVQSGPGTNYYSATAGNDIYAYDSVGDAGDVIFGYDAAGSDSLQFVLGAFGLANQTGPGGASVVTAAPGTNIAGADVVIWNHWAKLDTAAKVDAMLQSQAGSFDGGVFVVAHNAGHKVAVYYDADANSAGGVTLVVNIDNLFSPTSMGSGDFAFV